MNRIVTYERRLGEKTELTPEQSAEIEALKNRPDSEIDFSDIPPLDERFWAKAVRNPYLATPRTPTKKAG